MAMPIFSSFSPLDILIRCDRVWVPIDVSPKDANNIGPFSLFNFFTASSDFVAVVNNITTDPVSEEVSDPVSEEVSDSESEKVADSADIFTASIATTSPSSTSSSSGPLVASKSSTVVQMQRRYYIMNLNSPNGIYLDGNHVPRLQWTQLREGMRLRFASRTLLAKNYIIAGNLAITQNQNNRLASIAAGGSGATGTFPSVTASLPSTPLSIQDVHIEYVFSHNDNGTNSGPVSHASAPTSAPSETAIDNNNPASSL